VLVEVWLVLEERLVVCEVELDTDVVVEVVVVSVVLVLVLVVVRILNDAIAAHQSTTPPIEPL
jgi:hypothetical protein